MILTFPLRTMQYQLQLFHRDDVIFPFSLFFSDPHLTTFDGLYYDFQSGCDAVFVQGASIGSINLDIHLRLLKLNGYSAIESVGVQLGSDIFIVQLDGTYRNGAWTSDLNSLPTLVPASTGTIGTFGSQDLHYNTDTYGTSTYEIKLPTVDGEDHYIAIDTFNAGSEDNNPDITDEKRTSSSMSVRIHGHGSVFSGSKGLCGDWDETTPDLYDRNGMAMTIPNPTGYASFYDATAFGNEWRAGVDKKDPVLLIPNQFSNNLNPSEWDANVCVEQGARRRILQDAKRKLDPCSKCDDLESSGAPQVQMK